MTKDSDTDLQDKKELIVSVPETIYNQLAVGDSHTLFVHGKGDLEFRVVRKFKRADGEFKLSLE